MIDPSTEFLIRFQEAPSHIPGNPSICALHRWRLRGVRGSRLETLLVGGTRFTSREAIGRFIDRQNSGEQPATVISPQRRARLAEAANAACIARGY